MKLSNIIQSGKKSLNKQCNKNACTCWFDGIKTFGMDWKICCQTHDKDYPHDEPLELSLLKAKIYNIGLVFRKYLYFTIGYIMYAGVRLFGRLFSGTR